MSKHKHAEFIKAWVDDSESVQIARFDNWAPVHFLAEFDNDNCKFRFAPKPEYRYFTVNCWSGATASRVQSDNIRATFTDGKLTAVEIITEGDGK